MRIKFGSILVGKKTPIDKVITREPELSVLNESMASLIDSLRGLKSDTPHASVLKLDDSESQNCEQQKPVELPPSLSRSSSNQSSHSRSISNLQDQAVEFPKSKLSNVMNAEDQIYPVHSKTKSETPSSLYTVDFPLDKLSFVPNFGLDALAELDDYAEASFSPIDNQQFTLHRAESSISESDEDENLSNSPQMVSNWTDIPKNDKKLNTLGKKLFLRNIDDSNSVSAISLSTEERNLHETVPSIGYFLFSNEQLQVYEMHTPQDLFESLRILSYASASLIQAKTHQPVSCIQWQSPAPQANFEKSITGKLVVKNGNLFSLVSLLISQESVADPDYLKDILTTYRYFSHPIDICRVLVLRYMEIYHDLVSESFYSGKSQLESNSFTQMRILNVFKKWTSDFTDDFVHFKLLDHMLRGFLVTYVIPDPKRCMFATSIMDKISERQAMTLLKDVSISDDAIKSMPLNDSKIHDTMMSEANLVSHTNASFISTVSLSSRRGSRLRPQATVSSSDMKSDDAIFDKKSIVESSSKSFLKGRTGSMDFLRKSPTYKAPSHMSSILPKKKSIVSASHESDPKRLSYSSSPNMDNQFCIADFDPDEIATQLTLMEQQQFAGIPISEFFNQKYDLILFMLILDGTQRQAKRFLLQI